MWILNEAGMMSLDSILTLGLSGCAALAIIYYFYNKTGSSR